MNGGTAYNLFGTDSDERRNGLWKKIIVNV